MKAWDRSAVISKIKGLRDDNKTLRAIADSLNAEGVLTKSGVEWTEANVSNFIHKKLVGKAQAAPSKAAATKIPRFIDIPLNQTTRDERIAIMLIPASQVKAVMEQLWK